MVGVCLIIIDSLFLFLVCLTSLGWERFVDYRRNVRCCSNPSSHMPSCRVERGSRNSHRWVSCICSGGGRSVRRFVAGQQRIILADALSTRSLLIVTMSTDRQSSSRTLKSRLSKQQEVDDERIANDDGVALVSDEEEETAATDGIHNRRQTALKRDSINQVWDIVLFVRNNRLFRCRYQKRESKALMQQMSIPIRWVLVLILNSASIAESGAQVEGSRSKSCNVRWRRYETEGVWYCR